MHFHRVTDLEKIPVQISNILHFFWGNQSNRKNNAVTNEDENWWLFLYSAILHSRLYSTILHSRLYSAILHSRADSLRSHLILHEWLAFLIFFFYQSGVLRALAWLMPLESAAVSACSVYTTQPCHFMQGHIRKVYACLAVTCHLHLWQNDLDLLRATAVTC